MRGPPSHFEAHSSPQQTQVLFRARPERRRVAREYDAALEQDEVPVAELEQLFHFLVDDQGRDPLIAKPPDGGPDLLADERSKAFGGAVQDHQPRIGEQRARDREHLLLASGQLGAQVRQAVAETREQRERALLCPAPGPPRSRESPTATPSPIPFRRRGR